MSTEHPRAHVDGDIEILESRSAGWVFRCNRCDTTEAGLTATTARARADTHWTAPPRDWGEHTPAKGLERIRTEMPGLMPELTDEDLAKADLLIEAARKPGEDRAGVQGCTSRIRHNDAIVECRSDHSHNLPWPDLHGTRDGASIGWRDGDPRIVDEHGLSAVEAAWYARGISEGRRQAEELAFDTDTVAKLLDLVHQYFDVETGLADPIDTAINVLTEAVSDHTLDWLGRENSRQAGKDEGVAEGRRQATEGWEREWAVELPDGARYDADDLEDARQCALRGDQPREIVSRLVGPWEPDLGEADWPGHQNFTLLPCIKIEGPHPKHTWSHRGEPCEGHVCPGDPPAEHLGTSHTPPVSSHTWEKDGTDGQHEDGAR